MSHQIHDSGNKNVLHSQFGSHTNGHYDAHHESTRRSYAAMPQGHSAYVDVQHPRVVRAHHGETTHHRTEPHVNIYSGNAHNETHQSHQVIRGPTYKSSHETRDSVLQRSSSHLGNPLTGHSTYTTSHSKGHYANDLPRALTTHDSSYVGSHVTTARPSQHRVYNNESSRYTEPTHTVSGNYHTVSDRRNPLPDSHHVGGVKRVSVTSPQTSIGGEHRVSRETGSGVRSGAAIRVEYRMTDQQKGNVEKLEGQVKKLEKDVKNREKDLGKAFEEFNEVKGELEALQKFLAPEAVTALVLECEQLKAVTKAELREKSDELAAVREHAQATIEDLTVRLTEMTREMMRQEALIRSNVEAVDEVEAEILQEVVAEIVYEVEG